MRSIFLWLELRELAALFFSSRDLSLAYQDFQPFLVRVFGAAQTQHGLYWLRLLLLKQHFTATPFPPTLAQDEYTSLVDLFMSEGETAVMRRYSIAEYSWMEDAASAPDNIVPPRGHARGRPTCST